MKSKVLLFCLPLFLSQIALPAESMKAVDKNLIQICVPHFNDEYLTLVLFTAKDQGIFAKNGIEAELKVVSHLERNSDNGAQGQSRKPKAVVLTSMGAIPKSSFLDDGVERTIANSPDECQVGITLAEKILSDDSIELEPTLPLFISTYGGSYDTHLVVSKDSPVKTVKDLKGKKIRLGQVLTHLALAGILREAGLRMSDIVQDYDVLPVDTLSALEKGQLSAVITLQPSMSVMLASEKVRILKENVIKNFLKEQIPHSIVIVNADFAKRSPQAVENFKKALLEAISYIQHNPSEIVYSLQRNSASLSLAKWQVDKATAEKAGSFVGEIKTYSISQSSDQLAAFHVMKNYQAMLFKLGYINHETNLDSWLTKPPEKKAIKPHSGK
jgi:ABC-type nitrate/sulfonate/bicarbonate transport system substrate-binding protein